MATGDIQSRNGLQDISNILSIFKGSGTTTQTDTSSEQVSTDKTNALLKNILESTSGLATVSSGQKGAGLYNSTVNQQLTNDLLSRASAQTAALSSTKTNTTSKSTGAQLDPVKTLLGLGLGQIATPVVKAANKKLGLDKLGENLSDSIFGNTNPLLADTPSGVAGFAPSPVMPVNALPDLQASDVNVASDSSAGSSGSAGATGSGSDVADMLGVAGASAGIGAALSGGSAAAGATALADASYAIGGTGTFLAADAAATAGTAAAASTAAATAATATEGAGILDTIATAAAAAWIICTELNKQGRLPYRYYIYGAREFAKYDERGKQGYYIWAIPSVRHLRKHPQSKYSKLMEVVFNARAEYLAAKAGCKGARKTVLGTITTHGLYAFCWILSRTIARKAYTKEQIMKAGS